MESSHSDRQSLRQRIIATREALPADSRTKLEYDLLQHLQKLLDALTAELTKNTQLTLGFCWPFRGEPDMVQLVTDWLAINPAHSAALPVVVNHGAPLAFRRWTPESTMTPDRYGIPTPDSGDLLTPTLLLIPVNGFDARGFRLGYGGGYFDRTLESFAPSPVTVGVGFELGRLPRIAEGVHDKALDWTVTEAGAFKSEHA